MLAIIPMLFVTAFAIVTYQQSFAACDYYGCYNYPNQKESPSVTFLTEHAADTNGVTLPSL